MSHETLAIITIMVTIACIVLYILADDRRKEVKQLKERVQGLKYSKGVFVCLYNSVNRQRRDLEEELETLKKA